jgi:5-methylcytosine-specific restriction endonuclease McrA
MSIRGLCPKCGETKRLTRHHIFPKRHFGAGHKFLFLLCRECHNELELDIPQTKVLTKIEYYQIIIRFLNRGKIKQKG